MELFRNAGLAWRANDLAAVLPLGLITLCFLVYWFVSKSAAVRSFFYRRYDPDRASVVHITFNRMFGFLMLGIVPALACLAFLSGFTLTDNGLGYKTGSLLFTVGWIAGLSVPVVLTGYLNASKPANLANYPQIRARVWTTRTLLVNAAGWALYLLAYEFLFRGVLLFPLAASLGAWPAVAVNVALYSATHIPKGLNEAAGAIVLGLLLCLLTLASGSIWIAFFVHLAMAWTNSFASLKFHPDMQILKR